jgi:hypothetical protein
LIFLGCFAFVLLREQTEMLITSADTSMWAVLPRMTLDQCTFAELNVEQAESWELPTPHDDDPGLHSEDGPAFVKSSAFLMSNISLAIGCSLDSDIHIQDPVIALNGIARLTPTPPEGVICEST